jgi:hypothetical protein
LADAVDDLGVFLFGIRRGVRFSRGDDPSVLNDERRIFNGWLPAAVDQCGSGENDRREAQIRRGGILRRRAGGSGGCFSWLLGAGITFLIHWHFFGWFRYFRSRLSRIL